MSPQAGGRCRVRGQPLPPQMSIDGSTIVANAEHRPWPSPARPWVMTMSWVDLLFAHVEVDASRLRQLVPDALELDLFEGKAYVGIVPFVMERVTARGLPELPYVSRFAELNVRTYVTVGGKPGVYFFSLDATSALAVWGARTFFHLPYFHAEAEHHVDDGVHHYRSIRNDRRAAAGALNCVYQPVSPPRLAREGLERFLVERYALYAVDAAGRAYRGEVHHARWSLQDATWTAETLTVPPPGLLMPQGPWLLHFAARTDVVAWALKACAEEDASSRGSDAR
jgi:uncharacterized protein YqjF (DUF2071 family)